MCLCVRAAGVLQNISAPAELHRGSVCHRQKWQRAHFHRGEHERQRAARASQRYENLRLWCHICQSCYTVFKNSFNITFTTESVPMYPWKLLFALNVRVANCMNCSLITLKKDFSKLSQRFAITWTQTQYSKLNELTLNRLSIKHINWLQNPQQKKYFIAHSKCGLSLSWDISPDLNIRYKLLYC